MIEYMVKVWHEDELRWQFIAKGHRGIYKTVRGPHLKSRQGQIHPIVENWAKDSDIPIDEVVYSVVPLDKCLDSYRKRGELYADLNN